MSLPVSLKNITNKLEQENTKMIPRHNRAYNEQYWYAENFLEQFLKIEDTPKLNILEIGTAEAGLLKYFAEKGHNCYGIEYSQVRFQNAIDLNTQPNLKVIHGDITKPETYNEFENILFDVIVVRDVIEHIPERETALQNIHALLKPEGKLFFSFPPKYSPFAGHQHVLPSKFCRFPYLYMLPDFIYKKYLLFFNIIPESVEYYLRIKRDRISINHFNHLIKKYNYYLVNKSSYFIRPNYEYRYNMKRKKNPLSFIPIFDELFSMGVIFHISKK